jgi:hypothetical protein
MLWVAAAFLGVNTASLYWPHYYVQLIAPLVLLAAVGATSGLARLPPALLVAAAAAPVLVFLVRLGDISPKARQFVVPYYHQFQQDEEVADSIDLRLRPGDTVYAPGRWGGCACCWRARAGRAGSSSTRRQAVSIRAAACIASSPGTTASRASCRARTSS